jgi:hypothetical protein
MPLSIPEAVGFIPKTTSLVMKAVATVTEIKAMPLKNAKTVGAAVGVSPGSLCDDFLTLIDDIVGAAKD